MIRIKVYKASQLAVVFAAVLLAVVLIVVLVSMALGGSRAADAVQGTTDWYVEENGMDVQRTAEKTAEDLAAVEVAAAFSMFEPVIDPIMPAFDEEYLPENEHTDETVDEILVEVVRPEQDEPEEDMAPVAQPRVLIYHTHTHEAYAQVADDPYEETEAWRTADRSHSVVRVGEALCELLIQHGFDVVHDQTDHEPPKLSTAYARSLQTLEGYSGQAFDLYIDLHRDAYNASMAEYAEANGQQMAQLMMLVGNGGDYEVKPDYEANLRFAQRLTACINEKAPGLCREVMVKNGRYNQHVGTPALLIEVGHNENTLQQALSAMPVLADALSDLMREE